MTTMINNRYENAINAANRYNNGEITAKQFMDEYGYIVFDALHNAVIDKKDQGVSVIKNIKRRKRNVSKRSRV